MCVLFDTPFLYLFTIFISCFCTLVFSVTLFKSNATTTLYLETVVTILTVLTTNGSQEQSGERVIPGSDRCTKPVATATSGSFVSSSIVNQVRLDIAVYVVLLLWYLKRGKLICLPRGSHLTRFVYLANFSLCLWYMLLLIHKVVTHITVELS